MTDAIETAAAEWFARRQGPDFSSADRAALDLWLAEPRHAVAFARMESAWERTSRLNALPTLAARRPCARSFARPLSRRWAAAAAVALIAAGAGWWSLEGGGRVYSTRVGEHRTVVLEDGSKIVLNTSSRVGVNYTPRQREIKLLSGEALFEVAKDPARPFVVAAADARVMAVGTAFNVRLRAHVVEVTVIEGVVAVDEAGKDVRALTPASSRVEAGKGAVVGSGALAKVELEPDAVKRRVAWREGRIEFKGETLEQAVAEFNRYRDDRIVVADARIASLRVGGSFQTDESDKFLAALQSGFDIRAIHGNSGEIFLVPE